jgi:hypothetical protein
MDLLFSNDFEQITPADLLDLVEVRKVREYVSLDYKQKAYDHKHAGKVDLMTDITAMANSRGGYIIIGVKEDENAPDGTPKEVIGIENGDSEANYIQSLCISCIDEPIASLKIRDIQIDGGRYCILIKVPDSPRKPHMVSHEKHRSFHVRFGRSNTTIGMLEVRNMILSMTSYQSLLTSFLEKRIRLNTNIAESRPFFLLMVTPIYVDVDKINPLDKNIHNLIEKIPGRPDALYESLFSGMPKPRIFGLEMVPEGRYDNLPSSLRLFRNGHFEYYEDYNFLRIDLEAAKPTPIDSYNITATSLHFLNLTKQLFDLAEIPDPLVITLLLGNVNPSCLRNWKRISPPIVEKPFTWKDRELKIEISVSSIDNPSQVTSQIIDQLFNAYGYPQNTHFDHDYRLIRPQ